VTPLASPRDVLELCIDVECLFEGGLVLLFIATTHNLKLTSSILLILNYRNFLINHYKHILTEYLNKRVVPINKQPTTNQPTSNYCTG